MEGNDALSFGPPHIANAEDWQCLVNKTLKEAGEFAEYIEKKDNGLLLETFVDPKYGNYYRNIAGIIEHTHYHLGQIALLKKLIRGDVAGNL